MVYGFGLGPRSRVQGSGLGFRAYIGLKYGMVNLCLDRSLQLHLLPTRRGSTCGSHLTLSSPENPGADAREKIAKGFLPAVPTQHEDLVLQKVDSTALPLTALLPARLARMERQLGGAARVVDGGLWLRYVRPGRCDQVD